MLIDVSVHLLHLLPVTEDFQVSGVFSKDEVKSIIEKRKGFEYGLKRLHKEKVSPPSTIQSLPLNLQVDFFRYIQYELQLDLLKRKRMKTMGLRSIGKAGDYYGIVSPTVNALLCNNQVSRE